MQQPVTSLEFVIRPSPETNDHETRIVIDGNDILEDLKDYMGLDPLELFDQSFVQNGTIIIGRCMCGVIGCGDYPVEVIVNDETVEWRGMANRYEFPIGKYREWIASAQQDHSWEDANRTAERLVTEILKDMKIDGIPLHWASARIKPKTIQVYFWCEQDQRMIDLAWDGVDPETAEASAVGFRKER